jgi:6-phospho-beta-glucosidase
MVALLEDFVIEMYGRKDIEGFRLVQSTRGGASYGEAGLDVVSAIWNNTGNVQIVDYPNMGTLQGIPREDVAQLPCFINRVGVWPLAMGDISRHMESFIQASKHYEILAVEAAMEGNYHKALEALVASPSVNSFEKSKNALDELLVAHKENLPNFAEAIAKLEKNERPY